jgi:predicted RND superfamily exporter protein
MKHLIARLYEALVLKHPIITLAFLTVVLLFFAVYIPDFRLDASADSLMLEDDRDLKTFRDVYGRYAIKEFVMVTYEPRGDLLSADSLKVLRRMHDELLALDSVDSIFSILDAPLLRTSNIKLTEITADAVKTLADDAIDLEKARAELTTNPIYSSLLIDEAGTTAALVVFLKTDQELRSVSEQRVALLNKKNSERLTPDEKQRLHRCEQHYQRATDSFNTRRAQDIAAIRAVIKPYNNGARVLLGGVPLIADDMLTFIRSDLTTFGLGVFVFIVATLFIIFRQVRWVVLPLITCSFAVAMMIGILGFVQWKVTVISSNFISLMLILTMEMNIHLAVRYRQMCAEMPEASHLEVIRTTAATIVLPCLYAALTTILAFCSLVFSGIRPVIDFGWMMTIGLTLTFALAFMIIPSVLLLLPRSRSGHADELQSTITSFLARIPRDYGTAVLVCAAALGVLSVWGISRLEVENSFVNYFKEKTEIYKGLKLIDDKLGGTTPLDVILHFKADAQPDTGDDWDDGFGWAGDDNPDDYWYTPFKIEQIKKVHDYFSAQPEIGQVLSLASLIRVIEDLNKGKPFDGVELGVLARNVPEPFKSEMLDPYVNIDRNEARITMRIIDSMPELRRNELLKRIQGDLTGKLGLAPEAFTVTGLMVLYNNMLQSLFSSQILTIGIVLAGIYLQLLVLFRSFMLAFIASVPNALAISIVLGIMGLCAIPLDFMTITIASITMGIAIDNSIHYIYRFRDEFQTSGDYAATMSRCHATVGKAIFNSSVTIIFGFSILMLSNFIPTIYFGIFTGLAMFIALLAVLTLLPKLLYLIKPFTLNHTSAT